MKHHFGDELDRSGGHWRFVPNAQRYAYHMPEWTTGHKQISIATISSGDTNWKLVSTFPNLEELTLHSPNQKQLEFVSQLWRLKRLRITHARPKSLDFLARLPNLEELIIEYVSGFDDLSPVGNLEKLRALHIENVRRVRDFSGVRNAPCLQYLCIGGTVDWAQPIESFEFLRDITGLEYLRLMFINAPKVAEPLAPLTKLKKLSKITVGMNAFPLEVFAWIEAKIPDVEGAVRPAYVKFGGEDREIHSRDIRFRMPIEEFEIYPDLFVGANGKRYHRVPHQAALLGRGARGVSGTKESVDKACKIHAEKYARMVSTSA
jgi:hypothetical protein